VNGVNEVSTMADSSRVFRAAFGSIAILGSAVLGVTVMTSTYAANNFNKAQCKVVKGKNGAYGLAIEQDSAANSCVCPPSSANQRRLRRIVGANGEVICVNRNTQQITNFNQPPGAGEPGGGDPGGGDPGGGDPGGGDPGGGDPGGGDPGGGDPGGGQPGGNTAKGNNGWGNGGDPENPGSDNGKGVSNHKGLGAQSQADSKQNRGNASENGGQHEGR
jgi:hypothetical protein